MGNTVEWIDLHDLKDSNGVSLTDYEDFADAKQHLLPSIPHRAWLVHPSAGSSFCVFRWEDWAVEVGKSLSTIAKSTLKAWPENEVRSFSECTPRNYGNHIADASSQLTGPMLVRAVFQGYLKPTEKNSRIRTDGGCEFKFGGCRWSAFNTVFYDSAVRFVRTSKKIKTVKFRKSSKKAIWPWTAREHWDRISTSKLQAVRNGLLSMSKDVQGYVRADRASSVSSRFPTFNKQSDFEKARKFFQCLKPKEGTPLRALGQDTYKWDPLRHNFDHLMSRSSAANSFKRHAFGGVVNLIRTCLMLTAVPVFYKGQYGFSPIEGVLERIPPDFKPVLKYVRGPARHLKIAENCIQVDNLTAMFMVSLNEAKLLDNDQFDEWALANSFEYKNSYYINPGVNSFGYKLSDTLMYSCFVEGGQT